LLAGEVQFIREHFILPGVEAIGVLITLLPSQLDSQEVNTSLAADMQ
jgi:hypothetical protein